MTGYLIVFLGGGIGAAFRHGVNRATYNLLSAGFPYGTLFVNVLGSLLIGALAELFLGKAGLSEESKLFLTTGFLGGFTTFSAFSLETALMWQRGDYAALATYTIGSVVLSVTAVFLGMGAVRAMA
jgi:CrcB protein